MALGAKPRRCCRHHRPANSAAARSWVSAGVALALAAARGASSLLFDLQPNDPFSFALATAVLVAIAWVASFVPARRAARVDPMVCIEIRMME